jgi:hypothetical protein
MSTELTVINNGPASIESYARDLESKFQVADLLLKSKMIPSHYTTREAVLTAVLYGQELGFSPLRALNSIVVIQGKATLEAQALKALAIAHGGTICTVEWTDQICTLECTRGEWKERATYTLDDAAKAGLVNKDNWRRMPKAMLYARAVSILVRNMFADILGGLYSRQEVEDGAVVEVVEVKEPKKTPRATKAPVNDDPEWLGVPAVDPLQSLRDAIDGEDWLTVGAHVIETKCSLQGMTVAQAAAEKRETLTANLKRFKNDADRLAVAAYLEAFPIESKPASEIRVEIEEVPNV